MRPSPAYPAKLSHQRSRKSSYKHLSPNYVLQVTSVQEDVTENILESSMDRSKLAFWLEASHVITELLFFKFFMFKVMTIYITQAKAQILVFEGK